MKFFLIGDELTVLGYRLVGIDGVVAKDSESATLALNKALSDPDVGIVLITQRIAGEIQPLVDSAKLRTPIPVVLEIPDRLGPVKGKESALSMVRRLMGIKV